MRTYPHVRPDGSVAYFEVTSSFPWAFGFMRHLLNSVEGVSGFKHQWFKDDRFLFAYRGRSCVVNEPFGDNSRYWIGPTESEPPLDMRPIQEAFASYRIGMTFASDSRE